MSFDPSVEFKNNIKRYMEAFYKINKLISDKNKSALIAAQFIFYDNSWSSDPKEKIHKNIIDIASLILTEDKINCLVGKGLVTIKVNNGITEISLTKKGIQQSLDSGNDIRNFE